LEREITTGRIPKWQLKAYQKAERNEYNRNPTCGLFLRNSRDPSPPPPAAAAASVSWKIPASSN
jgi:hypothetical protein